MIAEWPGLVDASERKGWEDGLACAPYEPIMQWGVNDAYTSAYFHGLAYGRSA